MQDLESLEASAAKAKETYRSKPTEKNKAAHRAASEALSEARSQARSDRAQKED